MDRGWSSHAGLMQAYFERRKGNGKKRNSQIHASLPMRPLQTAEYFWARRRRQEPSVHPPIHSASIMGKQTQGEKKRRKEKEKWLSPRNQKNEGWEGGWRASPSPPSIVQMSWLRKQGKIHWPAALRLKYRHSSMIVTLLFTTSLNLSYGCSSHSCSAC
jgi:hypothetical protein